MLGHQRVLVMDPTLAAVRDALRLLALPNGPLHVHRGLVVLNHLGRPGELTRSRVEEALKMKVDVVIPDLPKLLNNAASMGEPAATRGAFHSGMLALVGQVAAAQPADGAIDGTSTARPGRWRRFMPFGR
jgi:pilus assembly protein CpaE